METKGQGSHGMTLLGTGELLWYGPAGGTSATPMLMKLTRDRSRFPCHSHVDTHHGFSIAW